MKKTVKRKRRTEPPRSVRRLAEAEVFEIAAEIKACRRREFDWETVKEIAERVTDHRYSKTALAAKDPIQEAVTAKLKANRNPAKQLDNLRIRKVVNIVTADSAKNQLAARDDKIKELKKNISKMKEELRQSRAFLQDLLVTMRRNSLFSVEMLKSFR